MKRLLLMVVILSVAEFVSVPVASRPAVSRPAVSLPEGRNLRTSETLAVGQQQVPPVTPQQTPPKSPQAQPSRDRARSATGTAVIRGRVFAADTGQPLRRARVNWSSDAPAPTATGQPPPRVMTDNEGRYEIRDLSAARYRVFAIRSGYLQMDFGARRPGSGARSIPTASERGIAIDLADGQVFDHADFRLPRAGVITGRIIDEYGDPLITAFVGASRQQTTNGRRRLVAFGTDTTDDNGEFRLSGLPPGAYYVVASAPGYLRVGGSTSYADLFYPGVPAREQARAVAVREGQETRDITFMLSPIRLARVSGTVVTSRGTVPRAATFTLTRTTDTGITNATVYGAGLTGEGNFTLPSVVPGDCDLVVSVQTDAGASEVGAVRLSVTGDDITGLTIATGAEGQLAGTVTSDTGAPLPGATSVPVVSPQYATSITMPVRVVANAVDTGTDGILGGLATGSTTNRAGAVGADGSFAAPVRPGPRVIGVSGLPTGWGLVSVTSGERDLTDVPVDIPQGSTLLLRIIVSNRLGEIAGSAVDASDRPTADYDIVLFPRNRSKWLPGSALIRTDRPNQRGEFRMTGVRPGDYFIAAVESSDDTDWTDPEVLDRLRGSSVEVSVGLGEKKAVQLKVTRIGA